MASTLGARLRRAFTLATSPPGHDREQRAPKVATGTVSYTTPGFPMYPEWSGAQALAQGYYRNVYVNRALSILAHDIAKLAFRAGATPPENLWDQPDHTPNARLAQLLGPAPKGPNPATSSLTMWSWTVVQFLAAGRFAWEAELSTSGPLDKRDILGLWPMSVQYVNPIPSQGGTGYFAGYEYSPNGTPTRLQPERVVYCWRPSQTDWRQPESALQSASLPVRIATTIDRYHWGLLENRNVPDTLVITPPFAEGDERRGFRDQFSAEYGGAANAGKTMFAEAEAGDDGKVPPIQVHRLAMTTKDAQLLELRAAALNDVSIATGVPKSKLGDASERTFSNAEEESANYELDTLVPLALELADKINLALAPRLGPEIGWFDLSQLPAVRQLGSKTLAPIGPPPDLNPAADPANSDDQPQPGPAAKAPGIPPLAAVGAAAGAEPGESRATGADEAIAKRSVMIALFPDATAAESLAVPEGERAEDLHLTLAFLGAADDLGNDGPERLRQILAGFATTAAPIKATISGVGKFLAGETPVTYASVDAPSLPDARQRLVDLLDAADLPPNREHGFTPHITLAYDDRELDLPPAPLTFRSVTLAIGAEREAWPLTGPVPTRSIEAIPATRHIPPPEPVDHEARRTKLWTATNDRVEQLERIWTRRMRSLFARQEQATLDRLEGRRGRQMARRVETRDAPPDPGAIFDQRYWADLTEEQTRELYEQVAAFAGFRVADQLGVAFDLEAPYVQEFIKARANQLAGQVTQTTYGQIRDALAEGVAAGEPIDGIAARVRHVFEVASSNRAEMIARTEVISAFNGSAATVANAYGPDVAAGQEWIATRDHRTRDTHRGADGQVVGIGQPFAVGGSLMRYPGDPAAPAKEVVRCRCTVAFLTPGDMGMLSRSALWTSEQALRVLALVEHRVITVEDVPRALEAVA